MTQKIQQHVNSGIYELWDNICSFFIFIYISVLFFISSIMSIHYFHNLKKSNIKILKFLHVKEKFTCIKQKKKNSFSVNGLGFTQVKYILGNTVAQP